LSPRNICKVISFKRPKKKKKCNPFIVKHENVHLVKDRQIAVLYSMQIGEKMLLRRDPNKNI